MQKYPGGSITEKCRSMMRPICGPVNRGFFARLCYRMWHCTLDMHTHRLVQKFKTLAVELAIPKKARKQVQVSFPLVYKQERQIGNPLPIPQPSFYIPTSLKPHAIEKEGNVQISRSGSQRKKAMSKKGKNHGIWKKSSYGQK